MNVQVVRDVLLWCAVINYALLALWGLLMMLPHDWLYRLWGRWLRLTPDQFDLINFGGIVFYKVVLFVFNLVPYVAIRLAT